MTRLTPLVAIALAAVSPAFAQTSESAPPAHVSFIDGTAVLERETITDEVTLNVPLVPGERLRTDRGRVELLFGDGSLVHVDGDSELELLSDTLVRLTRGRIAVIAAGGTTTRFQVDTPGGSARLGGAGEYRMALLARAGGDEVEVAVVRGTAELSTSAGAVLLRPGERALAREGDQPSAALPWNSANWDAFDQWSRDRLDARRVQTSYVTSSQYVPAPLQIYAPVLDTWGYWGHQPAYGYVWYPRVAVGWRPYHHGRWRFVWGFGWTWIGADWWAWPTHHYGRWGISSAGAWFWIPGQTWGPAWVHWGYSGHYVSWCALGWNNRPVVGWWGHSYARAYHHHAPWRAWTVVPRHQFGHGYAVPRYAVDARRFSGAPASNFVLQDRPPAALAPTRGGVQEAGRSTRLGTAVPRGGSAASLSPAGGRGRVPRDATAGSVSPPPASRAGMAAPSANPRTVSGAIRRGSTADGSVTTSPAGPASSGRVFATPPPSRRSPSVVQRTPGSSTSAPAALAGGRGIRTTPGDGPSGAATAPASRQRSAQLPPPSVDRRTAVPRGPAATPAAGWRPEQVPVHRGMPPAQAPPAASVEGARQRSSGYAPSAPPSSPRRGGGTSAAPSAPPERYMPRAAPGEYASPRAASPRGGSTPGPAAAAPPPPAPRPAPQYAPPRSGPPPSAAPPPSRGGGDGGARQAPARGGGQGGGGGHAVPRGGARSRG